LGIDWPIREGIIVSERDKKMPTIKRGGNKLRILVATSFIMY